MFQKHKCPYCGNNPIPHYLNWYFDSINILFEKLQIGFLVNPVARFVSRFEDDIALALIGIGRLLGIIHLGKKPTKKTLSRAQVLWDEAEKRGLEMREVKIFERSVDAYIVRKPLPGKRWKQITLFTGLPRPKEVNHAALAVMDDKAIFKKTCEKHGFPAPRGGYAASFSEAKSIFDRIDKPVIVKPRLGSRGRHVLTYIYTEEDLRKAYKIAKQLCLWVIVEEQIIGPVYRGTVINYTLEGVLGGFQPEVTGDGQSSLRELIEQKNKKREEGISEIWPDEKMDWFIKRQLDFDGRRIMTGEDRLKGWKIYDKHWNQNLFERYTPKKGEIVYLSEKIGVSYGGGSAEEYTLCHPDNKELFEKAAKIFDDTIIGFDFMIPDITKSWREQRCGFLEANSVPFINLHHFPLKGKPRNVAAKVWDLVKL